MAERLQTTTADGDDSVSYQRAVATMQNIPPISPPVPIAMPTLRPAPPVVRFEKKRPVPIDIQLNMCDFDEAIQRQTIMIAEQKHFTSIHVSSLQHFLTISDRDVAGNETAGREIISRAEERERMCHHEAYIAGAKVVLSRTLDRIQAEAECLFAEALHTMAVVEQQEIEEITRRLHWERTHRPTTGLWGIEAMILYVTSSPTIVRAYSPRRAYLEAISLDPGDFEYDYEKEYEISNKQSVLSSGSVAGRASGLHTRYASSPPRSSVRRDLEASPASPISLSNIGVIIPSPPSASASPLLLSRGGGRGGESRKGEFPSAPDAAIANPYRITGQLRFREEQHRRYEDKRREQERNDCIHEESLARMDLVEDETRAFMAIESLHIEESFAIRHRRDISLRGAARPTQAHNNIILSANDISDTSKNSSLRQPPLTAVGGTAHRDSSDESSNVNVVVAAVGGETRNYELPKKVSPTSTPPTHRLTPPLAAEPSSSSSASAQKHSSNEEVERGGSRNNSIGSAPPRGSSSGIGNSAQAANRYDAAVKIQTTARKFLAKTVFEDRQAQRDALIELLIQQEEARHSLYMNEEKEENNGKKEEEGENEKKIELSEEDQLVLEYHNKLAAAVTASAQTEGENDHYHHNEDTRQRETTGALAVRNASEKTSLRFLDLLVSSVATPNGKLAIRSSYAHTKRDEENGENKKEESTEKDTKKEGEAEEEEGREGLLPVGDDHLTVPWRALLQIAAATGTDVDTIRTVLAAYDVPLSPPVAQAKADGNESKQMDEEKLPQQHHSEGRVKSGDEVQRHLEEERQHLVERLTFSESLLRGVIFHSLLNPKFVVHGLLLHHASDDGREEIPSIRGPTTTTSTFPRGPISPIRWKPYEGGDQELRQEEASSLLVREEACREALIRNQITEILALRRSLESVLVMASQHIPAHPYPYADRGQVHVHKVGDEDDEPIPPSDTEAVVWRSFSDAAEEL